MKDAGRSGLSSAARPTLAQNSICPWRVRNSAFAADRAASTSVSSIRIDRVLNPGMPLSQCSYNCSKAGWLAWKPAVHGRRPVAAKLVFGFTRHVLSFVDIPECRMNHPRLRPESGPFRADQLRDGDRYELSRGHPIYSSPMSPEDAVLNLVGAEIIASDPDVAWAGVDAGFSPEPGTRRPPPGASADESPRSTPRPGRAGPGPPGGCSRPRGR